jgi:O-methyltransferase
MAATASGMNRIESDSVTAALYLDLLKNCLSRCVFADRIYEPADIRGMSFRARLLRLMQRWLRTSEQLELLRVRPFDPEARKEGRDWPPPRDAETMIGLKRLENIQYCVVDVLRRGVPGDLIETGVWRGGAVIFMRAILKAYRSRTPNGTRRMPATATGRIRT